MAANVIASNRTKILIRSGGTGSYVAISGITAFSGLGSGSAAVIDITDLDSTRKEKLMGIADEGSFNIDFNVVNNDPGQLALETARNGAALVEFRVSPPTGQSFEFDGYVTTCSKDGGVDQAWTGSATIEIIGEITRATVSA